MRPIIFMNVIIIMLLVSTIAFSAEEDGKALFSVANKISGNYFKSDTTVTIHGKIYEKGFWLPYYTVTLDIRGWDYLSFSVAIRDDGRDNNEFAVKIDAEEVWRQNVKRGEVPIFMTLDIRGHDSITLIAKETQDAGGFMEPRLYKGEPPSDAVQSTEASPVKSPSIAPATFAVDPKDLDTLAASIRTSVDADPDTKTRVEEGQMALMTFILLDIDSPTVASNVAEDLSTAMIKNKFHLVERGQLDKVLKELKIQDTGLIDPSTAKEIGNLTGCDLILVGSISDRGQFVVINARLLETETGKALIAERVEMRKITISP